MRKRRGRGEGAIYERSDGLWVGSVSFGYGEDGRRRRRVIYGKTKQEIQQKLRQTQTEQLLDTGRMTVGQWLDRWLTIIKPKVRPATSQHYDRFVRIHLKPAVGGILLRKLEAIHVENAFAEMDRNGASVHCRRAAAGTLSCALRRAVKAKLIPHNPAADVEKPQPEFKEMLFLTPEECRRFLDAAKGYRQESLFILAIASGMRQGELLALRWSDIDFDHGVVSVHRSLAQLNGEFVIKEPKSKSSRRSITLPKFAMEALKDHRAAMLAEGNISNPVFCTSTGQYVNKSNLIGRMLKPIIRRANNKSKEEAANSNNLPKLLPDFRFHDLRHSHATALLSQGHSIKAVSHRLGHADAGITLKVYAHVLPTDDAKLADGLERLYG